MFIVNETVSIFTGGTRAKYMILLTVTLIMQFIFGLCLLAFGGLAEKYSDTKKITAIYPCHAGVFITGFLMIIAGIVSFLIRCQSEHEQKPCLVYVEQGLCGAICLCAFVAFIFCVMASIGKGFEDCTVYICTEDTSQWSNITVVNLVLMIASACISLVSICCSCRQGHLVGVERQCCNVSRPRDMPYYSDYVSGYNPRMSRPIPAHRTNQIVNNTGPPGYQDLDLLEEQNRLLQEQNRLQREQLELRQQLQQPAAEERPVATPTAPPISELPPPSYEEYMSKAETGVFQKQDDGS